MKKVDIKKLAGAGVLSVGLVFGMAGFAGALNGTIDTTGPNSENEIEYESEVELDIENKNDLDLNNSSSQSAQSGETTVRYNTTGGSAMSGDADNSNSVSATVMYDNSGSAAAVSDAVSWGGAGDVEATIENTGPRSENEVEIEHEVEVDIENRNYVDINNTVEQSAESGEATVRFNTTGGDATSGSVSNTSSSSFNVSITN